MKTAIVVGAAGFVGYHLTKTLSENGYRIWAVVRPHSPHNNRISDLPNVRIIELEANDIVALTSEIHEPCDYLFNLVWQSADRYDYAAQMENVYLAYRILEVASALHCRRYIGIGSQAEYGTTSEIIREDETALHPFCGYGSAKIAACAITKKKAAELNIEWVWGRIFSVFGKFEPESRLLPHIINSCRNNESIVLSSCRQNWDFLYGSDAGEALLALAEKGRNGEIYNIANGNYEPLKRYVEEIVSICGNRIRVSFGEDPNPFVSLQPSVEKLQRDTGWYPKTSFRDGIIELTEDY